MIDTPGLSDIFCVIYDHCRQVLPVWNQDAPRIEHQPYRLLTRGLVNPPQEPAIVKIPCDMQ